MNTELRQLAIDVYNGVDVKFENGETGNDMIRNAINKAFGNINLNDANAVKRAIAYGKVDFEIINELIDTAINLSAPKAIRSRTQWQGPDLSRRPGGNGWNRPDRSCRRLSQARILSCPCRYR